MTQQSFAAFVAEERLRSQQRAHEASMLREYEGRRSALIAYLKVKCDQADWHGVSDAANDLRVMEAEHLSQSLRDLGKYAPIIEALNAQSAR